MIGRVIKGKYRILEEIGAGTVATVYLARNLATKDDGATLASGSADGTVRLWGVATD